jgi:hypothetical protein
MKLLCKRKIFALHNSQTKRVTFHAWLDTLNSGLPEVVNYNSPDAKSEQHGGQFYDPSCPVKGN